MPRGKGRLRFALEEAECDGLGYGIIGKNKTCQLLQHWMHPTDKQELNLSRNCPGLLRAVCLAEHCF